MSTLFKEKRAPMLFGLMFLMLVAVGVLQSWSVTFTLLNLCLISAIMALGVNIQWGYAGLFNVGVMGFAALGGLAAILVSMPPQHEGYAAGGLGILGGLAIGAVTVFACVWTFRKTGKYGYVALVAAIGYLLMRAVIDPAVAAIEAVDPSVSGWLGGLGLPIVLAWPVGALFAAGAAWLIGKVALGLRSDYLAIATLGISEIIIFFLKNEDWLTRGVKNVNGLPRPVPYEVDLQTSSSFQSWAQTLGMPVDDASGLFVKILYTLLVRCGAGADFVSVRKGASQPLGPDDARDS